MKEIKPEQGWAIVVTERRSSWVMPFTIRRTRSEAIQRFVEIYRGRASGEGEWRKNRDSGRAKCVRVVTTVVSQ